MTSYNTFFFKVFSDFQGCSLSFFLHSLLVYMCVGNYLLMVSRSTERERERVQYSIILRSLDYISWVISHALKQIISHITLIPHTTRQITSHITNYITYEKTDYIILHIIPYTRTQIISHITNYTTYQKTDCHITNYTIHQKTDYITHYKLYHIPQDILYHTLQVAPNTQIIPHDPALYNRRPTILQLLVGIHSMTQVGNTVVLIEYELCNQCHSENAPLYTHTHTHIAEQPMPRGRQVMIIHKHILKILVITQLNKSIAVLQRKARPY